MSGKCSVCVSELLRHDAFVRMAHAIPTNVAVFGHPYLAKQLPPLRVARVDSDGEADHDEATRAVRATPIHHARHLPYRRWRCRLCSAHLRELLLETTGMRT